MQNSPKSFIFLFVTLFILIFSVKGQSNAKTSIINEGIRFPDGSIQTTKAVWSGATGPQGPQGATGATGSQGPTGPGCLGVYDGNNVFLGYLISGGGTSYLVFNPNIPGTYIVKVECVSAGEPCFSFPDDITWLFTSGDCTGQAYVETPVYWLSVMHYTLAPDIFFLHDTSVPPVTRNQIKSYYILPDTGNCISYSSSPISKFYPIKQITFPLAGVELAYPITIRQVQ
jgi:hypothetical protein